MSQYKPTYFSLQNTFKSGFKNPQLWGLVVNQPEIPVFKENGQLGDLQKNVSPKNHLKPQKTLKLSQDSRQKQNLNELEAHLEQAYLHDLQINDPQPKSKERDISQGKKVKKNPFISPQKRRLLHLRKDHQPDEEICHLQVDALPGQFIRTYQEYRTTSNAIVERKSQGSYLYKSLKKMLQDFASQPPIPNEESDFHQKAETKFSPPKRQVQSQMKNEFPTFNNNNISSNNYNFMSTGNFNINTNENNVNNLNKSANNFSVVEGQHDRTTLKKTKKKDINLSPVLQKKRAFVAFDSRKENSMIDMKNESFSVRNQKNETSHSNSSLFGYRQQQIIPNNNIGSQVYFANHGNSINYLNSYQAMDPSGRNSALSSRLGSQDLSTNMDIQLANEKQLQIYSSQNNLIQQELQQQNYLAQQGSSCFNESFAQNYIKSQKMVSRRTAMRDSTKQQTGSSSVYLPFDSEILNSPKESNNHLQFQLNEDSKTEMLQPEESKSREIRPLTREVDSQYGEPQVPSWLDRALIHMNSKQLNKHSDHSLLTVLQKNNLGQNSEIGQLPDRTIFSNEHKFTKNAAGIPSVNNFMKGNNFLNDNTSGSELYTSLIMDKTANTSMIIQDQSKGLKNKDINENEYQDIDTPNQSPDNFNFLSRNDVSEFIIYPKQKEQVPINPIRTNENETQNVAKNNFQVQRQNQNLLPNQNEQQIFEENL